jgi:hypothetical protein
VMVHAVHSQVLASSRDLRSATPFQCYWLLNMNIEERSSGSALSWNHKKCFPTRPP